MLNDTEASSSAARLAAAFLDELAAIELDAVTHRLDIMLDAESDVAALSSPRIC
jgi:hypothetical protein